MSEIPKGWSCTALLSGHPSSQTLNPLAWFQPTSQRSRDHTDDKVPTYGLRGDAFRVEAQFLQAVRECMQEVILMAQSHRELVLACSAVPWAFWFLPKSRAVPSPSLLCPLQPVLWTFPVWKQRAHSSNLTRPAGLCCSPGQMQSLNRYDLYDADRPVYCPSLGLCETCLTKCKAVGGFRCSWLLAHKDQKVSTFGRR